MARTRSIKPAFFDDTKIARCSIQARLLFIGLWTQADRDGIFDWDPLLLRKTIFGYDPFTVEDVQKWLLELSAQSLIKWTKHEESEYGLIPNFAKHQHFHHDEKARGKPGVGPGLTWGQPGVYPSVICNLESVISIPESVIPKSKRAQRAPDQQAKAKRVKEAFFAGYRRRYGVDCPTWGAPQNAHVYRLLQSNSLEDLVAKARAYFEWPNKKAIDAGHPFMSHYASFSSSLSELTADMIAPERRKESAQVHELMKLADKVAIDDDGINRINALMEAQKDPFDDQRWLEESGTETPRAIAQGNSNAGGSALQESERAGFVDLVSQSRDIRNGTENLERIGEILRSTTDAINRRGQGAYRKQQAGMPAVQTDADIDARGAQEIFGSDEEMPF